MISINISTAVVLYLMVTLFGIFYLWVRFEKSNAFKKYTIHHKEVWNCQICAYTYVDSKNESLSQCPQCESWNKKGED